MLIKVPGVPGENACEKILFFFFESEQIDLESGTTFNSPSTDSKHVKWGGLVKEGKNNDKLPRTTKDEASHHAWNYFYLII